MFEKGQKVVIIQDRDSTHYMPIWEGYVAKVIRSNECAMTFLEPIDSRPDGHGLINFFWDTPDLRIVD